MPDYNNMRPGKTKGYAYTGMDTAKPKMKKKMKKNSSHMSSGY